MKWPACVIPRSTRGNHGAKTSGLENFKNITISKNSSRGCAIFETKVSSSPDVQA